MKFLDGFKRHKQVWIILSSVLLLAIVAFPIVLFAQKAQFQPSPDKEVQGTPSIALELPGRQTQIQLPAQSGMPAQGQSGNTQAGLPSGPSAPGNPTLQRLELVTSQAFGDGSTYVPNSWGQHKNRIIRTSTGDIFTVYISGGSDLQNRQWHLMHRPPNGGWQEINSGNAGAEPINIVRGPNDEIYIFTWPGTNAQLEEYVSTDLGKTFKTQMIAGQWSTDQGYATASINTEGDIAVVQTGNDVPGIFYWAYYSRASGQWQFHMTQLDIRYTYAFVFPGTNGDITVAATRDALRHELGYPSASGGNFDYIFNQLKYFHITSAASLAAQQIVASIQPQGNNDYDITYMTDAYMDTLNRLHILFFNMYDNMVHHLIMENGTVVKQATQSIDFAQKARIFQDAEGHFYFISTSQDGSTLNVYPGTANDTDGTQLQGPVRLSISQLPGCNDFDFCHSPNMTLQRNGHALSNYIDGVYGNMTKEIYFRISLR